MGNKVMFVFKNKTIDKIKILIMLYSKSFSNFKISLTKLDIIIKLFTHLVMNKYL